MAPLFKAVAQRIQSDEQLRRVLRLKLVIFVGLVASTLLPPGLAVAAGLVTNSIWLWRL